MDHQTVFNKFLNHLCEAPEALAAYPRKRTDWTPVVTQALVQTGRSLYPNCTGQAARQHLSQHGKSEHLGLDVTVYRMPLGPICFAAEHENQPKIDVLEYQSWKLLNVSADTRVLVGYWRARSRSGCANVNEVVERIRAVAENVPGQLLLILGDYDRRPSTQPELKEAFDWFAVGPSARSGGP